MDKVSEEEVMKTIKAMKFRNAASVSLVVAKHVVRLVVAGGKIGEAVLTEKCNRVVVKQNIITCWLL